jgi:hypothetical protein
VSQDVYLYLPLAATFDVLRSRLRDPFRASPKIEGLGELDEQLQQISISSADGQRGSWIEGSERVKPDDGAHKRLASYGVDPGNYRSYLVHASRWAWRPFDEVLKQLVADDRAYVQVAGYGDLWSSENFLKQLQEQTATRTENSD